MGYTHYFPVATPSAFIALLPTLAADTERIVAKAGECGIALAGPLGDGRPEVTPQRIALNGVGDESHETFVLDDTHAGFNFCKTARKPYDAVVTAVLLRAHALAPEALDIASDGNFDVEWQGGIELYRRTFGTVPVSFDAPHPSRLPSMPPTRPAFLQAISDGLADAKPGTVQRIRADAVTALTWERLSDGSVNVLCVRCAAPLIDCGRGPLVNATDELPHACAPVAVSVCVIPARLP